MFPTFFTRDFTARFQCIPRTWGYPLLATTALAPPTCPHPRHPASLTRAVFCTRAARSESRPRWCASSISASTRYPWLWCRQSAFGAVRRDREHHLSLAGCLPWTKLGWYPKVSFFDSKHRSHYWTPLLSARLACPWRACNCLAWTLFCSEGWQCEWLGRSSSCQCPPLATWASWPSLVVFWSLKVRLASSD